MKKPKIVLVGGGSVNWSPKLIRDLMLTPELSDARYVILDTDDSAGARMAGLGSTLAKEWGLGCTFTSTVSQRSALSGADYVIITISTGGLDAMEFDIGIPEEYGIYQTVGDTVGPGGWARALRNIPVFKDLAMDLADLSPDAVVLNYTNPMGPLTQVLYETGGFRAVGLCHGLFEVYAVLQAIFGLKSEESIKVRFGGINHFFWLLEMTIDGKDGYELLKKRLGNRSFAELVAEIHEEGMSFHADKRVASELLDTYGYLPYVGDRHVSEFFSSYLTDRERIAEYRLKRTSVAQRRAGKERSSRALDSALDGSRPLEKIRSRETAADIIAAFESNRDFVDVVNLPNTGQIPSLPDGAVVETLGLVNRLGFTPLHVGKLPQQINSLVLPHSLNQIAVTQAGLEGDPELALYSLMNDPMCSHLAIPQIREMGLRLLRAHMEYLPQFAGRVP